MYEIRKGKCVSWESNNWYGNEVRKGLVGS